MQKSRPNTVYKVVDCLYRQHWCVQVAALPHKALVSRFGEERATIIARAVRGYSDEPVQASTALVPSRMCLFRHGQFSALA